MKEYKETNVKSYGHTWLEHIHNEQDWQLWGERGFIYRTSDPKKFGVYILDHNLANKLYPLLEYKYRPGAEVLKYIGAGEVAHMAKRLRVPSTFQEQLLLQEAYERGDSAKNAPAST